MSWKEIVIGYGLVPVPNELVGKEVGCCYPPCVGGDFKNRKLYTDKGIDYSSYQRMVDRIRNNSYCKMHAMIHFGGK
jgi:hypothetical protein